MPNYDSHEVTTKAALYTTDHSSVLTLKYPRIPRYEYGLPGGHVDRGETPDQAMTRELQEELGLVGVELERKDFFVHASGKIVLAYIGKLDIRTAITPSDPNQEIGVWMTREEFKPIDIDPSYREFVLRSWPAVQAL